MLINATLMLIHVHLIYIHVNKHVQHKKVTYKNTSEVQRAATINAQNLTKSLLDRIVGRGNVEEPL